jgi:DNA-binding response OmpR family regulator
MSVEEKMKKKILLAEDDSSMRRFVEVILQKASYTVVPAEDGLAAMEIALAEPVDIVVADAMMPNLSGHDLCRILRQNPQTTGIPFIILSGFDQSETAESKDCLADVYLQKGANLKNELLSTISQLLARQPVA